MTKVNKPVAWISRKRSEMGPLNKNPTGHWKGSDYQTRRFGNVLQVKTTKKLLEPKFASKVQIQYQDKIQGTFSAFAVQKAGLMGKIRGDTDKRQAERFSRFVDAVVEDNKNREGVMQIQKGAAQSLLTSTLKKIGAQNQELPYKEGKLSYAQATVLNAMLQAVAQDMKGTPSVCQILQKTLIENNQDYAKNTASENKKSAKPEKLNRFHFGSMKKPLTRAKKNKDQTVKDFNSFVDKKRQEIKTAKDLHVEEESESETSSGFHD